MDASFARKHAVEILGFVKEARDAGKHALIKRRTRNYVDSSVVKLDAAYRVLGRRATFEQASHLARCINLFAPCVEPVFWRYEPKRTHGFRVVCVLPPTLKAAHRIIKDVLQVLYRPCEHIYNVKRMGRNVEARAIKEALDAGYRHCFVGDLRDAFQSVNADALYNLPLPNSVIRHMLDYRNLNLQPAAERDRDPHSLSISANAATIHQPNGPTGLLQGSPASNLILNWLLNDIPSVLSQDRMTFLFSDNILVAATSEEECQVDEQTLGRYFAEHPAGPFDLTGEVVSIRQGGMEKSGYQFEISLRSNDVEIAVSGGNFQKLAGALLTAIEVDVEARRTSPDSACKFFSDWLAGFPAITDRSTFLEAVVEQIFCNFYESMSAVSPKRPLRRKGPLRSGLGAHSIQNNVACPNEV